MYQLWPPLLTTLLPVRAHTHFLSHTRTLMQQVRSPRPINGRRSHAAPIFQPYPRNAASTRSTSRRNYHHRSSSIYTCHSGLKHQCVPWNLPHSSCRAYVCMPPMSHVPSMPHCHATRLHIPLACVRILGELSIFCGGHLRGSCWIFFAGVVGGHGDWGKRDRVLKCPPPSL